MKKAGGLVALIGGLFGVVAAVLTLMVGGCGMAIEAEEAGTVVGLGWGGVAFSFLAIILGAVAMGARSRWPGVLLVVCALLGIVFGGTLVAVTMVLALAGGTMAIIGKRAQ